MKKTQSTNSPSLNPLQDQTRDTHTRVIENPGRILFLCTGNYYRSRMAEEIFNHYAEQERLPYRAFSRGLANIFSMPGNVGPMSPMGIKSLVKLGIHPRNSTTLPKSLSKRDLSSASKIIALRKSEHEPMVRKKFPQIAGQVIYWDIPDVGEMSVNEAALTIQRNVLELIRSLEDTS